MQELDSNCSDCFGCRIHMPGTTSNKILEWVEKKMVRIVF